MDDKNTFNKIAANSRFQNLLQYLSKCKHEFNNEKEDLIKTRNINIKLETELKEARELEKSHRYHLLTSREMINNLQETVSQLVYLKRDVKRLKDEITSRDSSIALMEKEKDGMLQKQNETVEELRNAHKQDIEELSTTWEKKAQQVQYDCDTQIAQFTCVIEELRNKLKDTEAEHREKFHPYQQLQLQIQSTTFAESLTLRLTHTCITKIEMNVLVLEYEEKVQRSVAQVAQLQDQLARQAAHTDANIDVYRRKLEELEEKLKQQQFKEYLAHSKYTSQYENRGERPYSVERDLHTDSSFADYNPINRSQKVLASSSDTNVKTQKSTNTLQANLYMDSGLVDYNPINHSQKVLASPSVTHTKTQKPVNTLQVMYQDNRNPQTKSNEKKGQFNITKKRKLYNEKDFLNM